MVYEPDFGYGVSVIMSSLGTGMSTYMAAC